MNRISMLQVGQESSRKKFACADSDHFGKRIDMLTKVKNRGTRIWHYVLTRDLKPLCTCSCSSPGKRRIRGDTLCRCFCHTLGPKSAKALCEYDYNLLTAECQTGVQLALWGAVPAMSGARASWVVVAGKNRGCQECLRIGIELTKEFTERIVRP